MTPWRIRATACVAAAVTLLDAGCSGVLGATPATPQLTSLTVAVVPALDSAGFFVALYDNLFQAQGLNVHFVPAVSSETEINLQAEQLPTGNPVDISCGAYPSYIAAQENWDNGERPNPAHPGTVAANLYIFAEGSIMTPGTQGLYVMPGSAVRTPQDLERRTVGVNAPGNILYLLVVSALADHGLNVSEVKFKYIPLPQMAQALKNGEVDAATLPEPFASQAEISYGVSLLMDLDSGATTSFPVQGCAVTREWAEANPQALAAFTKAYEQGQGIADTDRAAVEQAMERLPAPLRVSAEVAAVMALDSYPVGVDETRIQRVADVMRQFLGGPEFNVGPMLKNPG